LPHRKLGAGPITGIVIGGLTAVLLIVMAMYFFFPRPLKKKVKTQGLPIACTPEEERHGSENIELEGDINESHEMLAAMHHELPSREVVHELPGEEVMESSSEKKD
jgi:hypothetical protein